MERGEQHRERPIASRPCVPGYPIADATGGEGLLPWGWAEERLQRAHNYWIATVRPSGAPHPMPVWGAERPLRGHRHPLDVRWRVTPVP